MTLLDQIANPNSTLEAIPIVPNFVIPPTSHMVGSILMSILVEFGLGL
jgi:hypothetical protein